MSSKQTKKKTLPEDAVRVIIAEDNATARKSLSSQLEALGFNVVAAAATGEEVCNLYQEHKPDLVIMDIKMPKMDGIEAARNITRHSLIPIILITGHSSETIINRAMESGVGIFAYLLKPVTKKDLLPAIKLAFARHNEFKTLKAEVNDLRDALETRKFVERAKGILMKRLSIPEDEAFKILQTQSQKENRKLRDIAETVITASKMI
ncbi:MAG TPA: response regulator [Deltaproteobacteria bacterium]|nr:MAG: hypothetical protein A2090_10140 [Deltaproteobacteria bacterium GWD2_42_10]OGP48108.1 MAG: hypothetical protein A2022_02205 [Deltaproteobacteria bacterium GWF2_42_12]OGQ66922.1 MAG: hypothetical protein A3F88_00325 [Deltaproteobacteria bacterium RIFCSPLOWO2_12_FULL_42_16]OGQ75153.1 MAG: hypothetical protein A2235_12770 [Deltaproteobacteria bacterium RIFOXYA2_FULL_42_10]HAG50489.1 response regulator [Deltaproteobacteria bacterium]